MILLISAYSVYVTIDGFVHLSVNAANSPQSIDTIDVLATLAHMVHTQLMQPFWRCHTGDTLRKI